MGEAKLILTILVPALQICLGIWQIMKFTPVGAFIKGVMRWLLRPILGLHSAYSLLRIYKGCVRKRVLCLTTTEHLPGAVPTEPRELLSVDYLGKKHTLEKRGEINLYVDNNLSYYIAPKIWDIIGDAVGRIRAANPVCITGYKEIWEGVATGDVMSLPEVLDSVILANKYLTASNCNILVPVNLSISEEKIPKFLNLVGLVLNAIKVRWFVPLSFSIMSAVVEFLTPLRVLFYAMINTLFCSAMHSMCDRLPYSQRREVYSLGNWIENLKPSNDIQFRVVRAETCVVPLAGGAKVKREGTTVEPYQCEIEEGLQSKVFPVNDVDSGLSIECNFVPAKGRASVTDKRERPVCQAEVECNSDDQFKSLCKLVSCIAKYRSGSLKSYEDNNKAKVYGLKDSVIHYAKSGFPPVYEVHLTNVVVT